MLYEAIAKKAKKKLSYFHCGEYGSRLGRPHYHAIIYGHDFPDRVLWKVKPYPVYTSEELSKLWPFGFSTVGHLTQESASYVARYTLKKVYGKDKKKYYGDKHPEYITMSKRPGIGKLWYEAFKSDIYPEGVYVSKTGVKQSPPKYYDRLYELENPKQMAKIKLQRRKRAERQKVEDQINGRMVHVSNSDGFRLPVRESIKTEQIKQLKRALEEE